jgi:hypothetical protein
MFQSLAHNSFMTKVPDDLTVPAHDAESSLVTFKMLKSQEEPHAPHPRSASTHSFLQSELDIFDIRITIVLLRELRWH